MEDEELSINASPTRGKACCSKRSQRLRRRLEKRGLLGKNGSNTEPASANYFEVQEELLFEADRLDCLRAQQEPLRARALPASQNFLSLEMMLESQQLPADPELPEPQPESIIQLIQRDFCSSPSYEEEEELPSYEAPPWFRFRNKIIRTFKRKRSTVHTTTTGTDEDERLSCSSELSTQEDFITQLPTSTHCKFDANSSQKICENLLNLSAYFAQNNANNSIDLPQDVQIVSNDSIELEDATDLLDDMGYLIGNTEECKFLDDNCDTKTKETHAELTLFHESARISERISINTNIVASATNLCDDWFDADLNTQELLSTVDASLSENLEKNCPTTQLESKETSESEMFDGIPLSEWQPMEIPDKLRSTLVSDTSNQELENNECNQLDVIPFSEWQLMDEPDFIQFRTASNKAIEVSEEKQKEAAKLMADIEETYSQRIETKTMKLIEEEERNAVITMVEASASKENNAFAADKLDNLTGFRTASNKIIEVTEQMQKAAECLLADLDTNSIKRAEEATYNELLVEIPLSEWQPMDISEVSAGNQRSEKNDQCSFSNAVAFRTASNKAIEISEERQKEAARLMADLEANYSQEPQISDGIEFRTPSNKTSQGKAVQLLKSSKISEKVEFRTASNKVMEITDEMLKKAAMLMADLGDSGSMHIEAECQLEKNSPKPKDISEIEDIQNSRIDKAKEKPLKPTEFQPELQDKKATPQQPKLEIQDILFETPKSTPEMQASLTQLSERSPLDKATKSSIITRRNLLSLNKRRRLKKDSENCCIAPSSQTPIRLRFNDKDIATSTPVINRKESLDEPPTKGMKRDRSCSQDSPRLQTERVGKRRSEDALSPIYAPINKSRRLGLSRIRNKSSNDI